MAPPKKKAPDPVVPPIALVPLVVGVRDGFNQSLPDVQVKVVNLKTGTTTTKTTDRRGKAAFGNVSPRTQFDITVGKSGFKPPNPGDDHIRRHAPTNKGGSIEFQLTQSVARLTVTVQKKGSGSVEGATVVVDGGPSGLPPTKADGTVGPIIVTPGQQLTIHVRKDGFSPDPPTNDNFNKEVVTTRTLADGEDANEVITLVQTIASLTIRVDKKSGGPLEGALVGVDGVTGALVPTKADGTAGPFLVAPHVPFRFHAQKDGFSPDPPTKDNFNRLVEGTRTLGDGEVATAVLVLAENPVVTPKIDPPGPSIVIVKKSFTKPKRLEIKLSIDTDFDGNGTLSVNRTGDGDVKAFDKQVDDASAAEVPIGGAGKDFSGTELKTGVKLFIEASATSSKLDDIELVLTLSGGTKNKLGPAKLKVTAAELTLDVCKSRTTTDHAKDPDPLSEADKTTIAAGKGRSVHRQIGNKHGRAMLIVRKPKPDGLPGSLTLTPITSGGGRVRLFDVEIAGPGDIVHAGTHEFPIPKADTKFFVEGDVKSTGHCDTGYQLGLKGVETEADLARVTVVEFTNFKISVPATLPNTLRMSNTISPANQDFTSTGTNAVDFDEDFSLGNLIVLLENSITALDPVELSVVVAPAGVPVSWSVRRDGGPNGDSPQILKLKPAPNDRPSLVQQSNPLEAHLAADSVGAFHLCAFVDCNGNGEQDFNDPKTGVRIDREPYIVFCLVLVRVQAFQNKCLAHPENCKLVPPNPTSATGVAVRTGAGIVGGALAPPDQQAIHFNATATLIGGGHDGKTGLDRVFGGWVNNLTACTIQSQFTAPASGGSPARTHFRTMIFVSNNPSVTPGTPGLFAPPSTITGPGTSIATPALIDFPILDTSPFPAANEGTGGNTASGTDTVPGGSFPVKSTNLPSPIHALPIGQDRQIQMVDTPSAGAPNAHEVFPGALTAFDYSLNFRCDLCFWTNLGRVPGPPSTPPSPNDVACLLYVSVLSNTWSVRCHVDFNAAGASTVTIKPTVSLSAEVISPGTPRLAKPINMTSALHEIRFPTVLRTDAQDLNK